MKINNFTKGILFLLTSSLLYSIMPVLIRFLGAQQVPPVSQVFLRYIIACIAACTYFYFSRSVINIRKKDLLLLFLVAFFGYALTNLFYTYAILFAQIGTVLFIFYCSSIIIPVVGFLVLKEKLNRYNIFALLMGFAALFFLFQPAPLQTWKLGAIFALSSAMGQVVYVIGRKLLTRYESPLILVANTLVGVITLGVLSIFLETQFYTNSNGITSLSLNTWILTVLFGIDNFAAWLFMTKGFQLVSAGTGSLVLLSENILVIALAFLFFAEIPTVTTLIGGMLILLASFLVIFRGTKQ